MNKFIKIKRRVAPDFKEIIEEVELIRMRETYALVKLSNGDVIKRKKKDIVDES